MPRFVRLVFARIGLLALLGDQRDAEILALRHQVLVLQRHGHPGAVSPVGSAAQTLS
jgi:hypothetical protein